MNSQAPVITRSPEQTKLIISDYATIVTASVKWRVPRPKKQTRKLSELNQRMAARYAVLLAEAEQNDIALIGQSRF